MKAINETDGKINLIGCVATFNADAYAVETEEQEKELLEEIAAHGVVEITDPDEFADAAARLDGDENTYVRMYRAGGCIFGELDEYDVVFHDANNDNNKGMNTSYKECLEYIQLYNGTDRSYFADYKGGIVCIHSLKRGVDVYEEEVR